MRVGILSRRATLYSTRRLTEAAGDRGHDPVVIDPLRCTAVLADRPRLYHGDEDVSDCDVVIPRIGASITEYGLAVAQQFEILGVPVVNGEGAIRRARDKFTCLQILARHGIPIPATLLAREATQLHGHIDRLGGAPVVLKVTRGTQGVGVMLAESAASAESILETLSGVGRLTLAQRFVAEARGRDLRLLVVDDEVVGAMRRYASNGDFRANIHRGGNGVVARPTPMARRLAREASSALGLAVAGVDLIETARGPLLLEVNPSPGFEEIERATGNDIAGQVVEYAAGIASHLRAVG